MKDDVEVMLEERYWAGPFLRMLLGFEADEVDDRGESTTSSEKVALRTEEESEASITETRKEEG